MTDLLPSADAPTRSPLRASDGSEPNTPDKAQRTRLVVDTSVLIEDPTCVLEFQDADVIVPLTVVEELDGLKSRPDDVGRSARTALRTLEELRVAHGGSLAKPVPTGNGIEIVIGDSCTLLPRSMDLRGVKPNNIGSNTINLGGGAAFGNAKTQGIVNADVRQHRLCAGNMVA